MKVSIYLNKSIEENAGLCYEKAKKLKKKMEGAKKALEESLRKLDKLEKGKKIEESKKKETIKRKKKWYEKFHWFISSEGFLVIGGRDATSNEIIIKKHTDKNDLVLHTDMTGSPFFVIKSEGKNISKKTIKEAADATVTFSRAWKLGIESTPTFVAKPEQLTKEAPAGEYVPKGGFITKGKLEYTENKVNLAVGIKDNEIMAGPVEAIKKNCENYVIIIKGREKTSQTAKRIQHKIGGDLDDIIRALPAGGCKVNA